MRKVTYLASAPLVLSVMILSTGCPMPQRNLEWAMDKADRRAPEGSILTGIAAVWVNEDGVLGERQDEPGYSFEFVSPALTSKFTVDVRPSGLTTMNDPVAFDGSDAQPLSPHETDDLADYIESALFELQSIPDDVAFNTSSLDIVVLVNTNPQDGSEEATVFFKEEADQNTDWSGGLDWSQLTQGADAYVILDTLTNDVKENSWEVSLHRALRLAQLSVPAGYLPVTVFGGWINRNGELGETADNPGWGFEFVSDTNTQIVTVTITRDGAVVVSPPETLLTPVTERLTLQTAEDLRDYIAAAVGAASAADELPETEDIFVRVGLNAVDASEEATVVFEPESDKAFDWATLDWSQIQSNGDAWVTLDTQTLVIEDVSWDD